MDQADFRFFGFADLDYGLVTLDGTYNVQLTIYDGDTRRWLGVTVVGVDRAKSHIMWDGPNAVQGWAPIHSALGAGIDSGRLGPDVTAATITFGGAILSISRDTDRDATPYVHYAHPDSYGLPRKVETVTRDQLVELGRLAPWVDAVSSRSERLVFKHYSDTDGIRRVWFEVQWLARLSGHPHVIPLRHLVVEGPERGVVGFTVPFLPGGSLAASWTTRPFRLQWVKQLCRVVDDLNLQYGIAHTDVRARNIMVDPTTDNLVLIDFGTAVRRGEVSRRHGYIPPAYTYPPTASPSFTRTEAPAVSTLFTRADAPPGTTSQLARDMEEEPDDLAMLANHDVASVIVLVNDLVTRSAADAAEWSTDRLYIDLLNGRGTDALLRQPWIAHPDALLDHPADEYRAVLADWLARRRAEPGHFLDHSSALQAFAFPDHMPMPTAEEVQDILNQQMAPWKFLRRDAVRSGRAVVDWVRPATVALNRSRTLLVTGVYLDDSDGDDDDDDDNEGSKQEARGMAKGQTAAKNQPGMPIRRSPRLAALLREASSK